ncbi:MAG: hypothetical protein KAS51_06390 [Candidatus Omnitrophica bacterium]|nr:hypothetical protein [Candidatus Omnitrophota bacterium]
MQENKINFDIHQYIRIVIRRKWFLMIPFFLLFISFTVGSFFLPKLYVAKAVILIEDKKVVNPLLQNLAVSTTVQSRLGALREEILSWPRLFQLVEKMELNKDVKGALELERLIVGIKKNINLKMRSNEVITISYMSQDPKNTQDLVNTLCDILINRNINSQTEDTSSAIDFINQQLEKYKEKLEQAETDLRKFKEVYGLGMITDVTASLGKNNEVNALGSTIFQINKTISAQEAELVMASIDCTDEHPRIKTFKSDIKALKDKRNKYIKEVSDKAGVDSDVYTNIADSYPRQQEELSRLNRDKAINEKIYAMFLERLETANITEQLDNSENRTKIRVIEPARFPLKPVKPNKIKISFLGLIFGLMIGGGLVYVMEYTDSSFKTEEDLKHYLDIPVFGAISKIITKDEKKKSKKKNVKVLFRIFLFAVVIMGVVLCFIHWPILKEPLSLMFQKMFQKIVQIINNWRSR